MNRISRLNRRLGLAVSIVFLTGTLGWLFFFPSEKISRISELQDKKSLTVKEMAELRILTKIEKRKNGWAKPDQPDEYITYYNLIRTPPGKVSPAYPVNYRFDELEKAKKRKKLKKAGDALFSELTWTERGPWNCAGRTRSLILDPEDETHSTWLAGAVSGGIWKTTNSGKSWVDLTASLPNLAVTALAMSDANPQVIYAGTGEGFGNVDAIQGDGIFKSADKGESWVQLESTTRNLGFRYINRLIADPQNENNLVVATKTGIYRTTDGGETFSAVYAKTPGSVHQLVYQPGNFKTQVASVKGNGIYRSTDGGLTWFTSKNNLSGFRRIELAVTDLDSNLVFAGVDGVTESYLYQSVDAGETWEKVTLTGDDAHWLGGQGWYGNAIMVHPYNKNIVFVGGIDIKKITLTGSSAIIEPVSSWIPGSGSIYVHADQHGFYSVKTNTETQSFRMIVTNDGGVEYSDDGGKKWNKTLNGYLTTQFYGVDKAPGTDEYFGGTQDNGSWLSPVWTSLQNEWTNVIGGDGFGVIWNHHDSNKLIGSLYYNILLQSKNRGKSWSSITGGPRNGQFVTSLGESNINPELVFVFSGNGVYRSENFGDSWALIPLRSPSWINSSTIGKVEISKHNPMIIWAGTGMENSSFSKSVHLSIDAGKSFTPVSNFGNLGYLSGLGTHPLDDSTAFVLFSSSGNPKVLKTDNLGKTWTDLSKFSGGISLNGFPDVATYCILVMPHNPSEIWVGTEIGLFISTDNGESWQYSDNGFPAVAIWEMKIVDDQVVIATHGRGIWTATIPALTTIPLPEIVASPEITSVNPVILGLFEMNITLKEEFDSAFVFINGSRVFKINNSSAGVKEIAISDLPDTNFRTRIGAYKNNWIYWSDEVTSTRIDWLDSQKEFASNLDDNNAYNLFISSQTNGVSDFINMKPGGFLSKGLSSRHPYMQNGNQTAMLKVPIIVKPENASVSFKNVAMVEPGIPGSTFGNDNFNDYVIVEGTANGKNWVGLNEGYNARKYPDWFDFYTNSFNSTPPAGLLKTENIDLLSVFSPGDTVVLRWRLFSNATKTGWGWFIDDIEIQKNPVNVDDFIGSPFELSLNQNYPNPFNPSTLITYSIKNSGLTHLAVYDALGRHVETLVNTFQNSGIYSVKFDGKSRSSGIYFVRMTSEGKQTSRKMLLLK